MKASCNSNCWAFCDGILPEVSRSFALIIPLCRPPLDQALCAAYLLCRIADTIEDEPALDDQQRAELYDRLLAGVDEPASAARVTDFLQAWPSMPEGSYGRLIEGTDQVLAAYSSLPETAMRPIRLCVRDMVAGMRSLRPFEVRDGIAFFCRDLDELDRYCHHVAGTVGIMSTALFESVLDGNDFKPTPAWREEGRRMGLGLQMTNIIKDCRVDARRGISYIPPQYVDGDHESYNLSRAGRRELIRHAVEHLDHALRYTLAVPRQAADIRSFLLGSLLPAIATLQAAAPGIEHQPKITRDQMSEILALISNNADDRHVVEWYQRHQRAARELTTETQRHR